MLFRGISNAIKSFARFASVASKRKQTSKQSKTKTVVLTPNCQQKLKEWTTLLSKEIEAEAAQYSTLLSQGAGAFESLETRGKLLSGLTKTADDYSPFSGHRMAFRVPAKKEGFGRLRLLKAGTPVTINSADAKTQLAEAIVEAFDETRSIVWIKLRKEARNRLLDRNERYSLLMSTAFGTYHSLVEYLKEREKQKHEKYPGDLIMSTAFRDFSFPTIQNDREVKTFSDCDESQKRAIAATMNRRRSFMCIQGPPGTGKTKVISEIIYQLTKKGQKVLVCAPSHAAVDNALDRVQDEEHAARFRAEIETSLQNEMESHEKYQTLQNHYKHLETLPADKEKTKVTVAANKLRQSIIKEIISKKHVLFCTVTSKMTWTIKNYGWEPNVVIIDEAAQCVEPASWVPILSGNRVILVGDHQQLPPVVFSEEARKQKLHISLMERLATEFKNCNINFLLTKQYRMNEKIMKWSSENFYDGRLEAAESNRHINLSEISNLSKSSTFAMPLLFFDTTSLKTPEMQHTFSNSFSNKGEANVVLDYVRKLMDVGVDSENIGVISPYYGQVTVLSSMLKKLGVVVNTVDAFQGQEKEVIIFSMVRDNPKGVLGFLTDYRRMNVAVTRAKRQFVLIGNAEMLAKDKMLRSFRETIRKEGKIIEAKEVLGLKDLLSI